MLVCAPQSCGSVKKCGNITPDRFQFLAPVCSRALYTTAGVSDGVKRPRSDVRFGCDDRMKSITSTEQKPKYFCEMLDQIIG